jgi:hypothetical protein
MAIDYSEIGNVPDRTYRPYLWCGEDQDNHVGHFRQCEELEMLRGAYGGGIGQMRAMAQLQNALNTPYQSSSGSVNVPGIVAQPSYLYGRSRRSELWQGMLQGAINFYR